MSPGPKKTCPWCGCELALGAIACFRCGRLLAGDASGNTGGGTDQANHPTRLGTASRAALLEERWLLKSPVGMAPGATLWLAQDTALDRPVTVKLLAEELASDPAAVARFEREARLFARLDHQNLALALSTGRHGALPFLVMKQLKGRSLAEVLHARGGRLSLAQAAAIGAELCEAIEALHQAGVVLSNLQPRQVHLEDTGEVVLIDLGSARDANDEHTRTGELLAEAGYRAPEVLAGGAPGPRSDVYSLGCVVYELIAGRPPFVGALTDVLAAGARATPAPSLESLVPEVPRELAGAMRDALSIDPARRPASAEVFRRALSAFAPHGAALVPVTAGLREATATEAVTAPVAVVAPEPTSEREAVTAPAVPAVTGPLEPLSSPELTRVAPPSGPQEAVSQPAQSIGVPPVEPTVQTSSLAEQTTRAIPMALTAPSPSPSPSPSPASPQASTSAKKEREAVTAPRSFLQQPTGRRAAFVAGLVATLLLVTVVSVSLFSSEVEPLAPEPIPRLEAQTVAPAPEAKKELGIDDVVAPMPTELEQREKQLKTVSPGKESFALARPKLRGGPAVTPWKIFRRGRKPVPASAQATVNLVALFKGKSVAAQVEIDGVWRGQTPLEVKLAPGDHALKLDYAPGALTEVTLAFLRGESVKLEIELRTREQAALKQNPGIPGAERE